MKNWKAVMVAVFLIGIVAGMAAAAPVKPAVYKTQVQKNYGLLTPGLFKKVQKMNWNQEVSTIIMFDNPQDRDRAVRILKLMGAEIRYNYKIIPAVAVKLKVRDLLAIAGMIDAGFFGKSSLSGVKFIQEDYTVEVAVDTEGLDESAAQVMATNLWNLGYDGSGITIGIIDTGIDASHPCLLYTSPSPRD